MDDLSCVREARATPVRAGVPFSPIDGDGFFRLEEVGAIGGVLEETIDSAEVFFDSRSRLPERGITLFFPPIVLVEAEDGR